MIFRIFFISILLLTSVAFYSTAQSNLRTRLREKIENQNLSEVLELLSERFSVQIDYRISELPKSKINVSLEGDYYLESLLRDLLTRENLFFQIYPGRLVIVRRSKEELNISLNPTKFNFSLRGKVQDSFSGESLPFATIMIKSTKKGTTSNVDGFFTLLDTPSDTSTLLIQYMGYESNEFKLNPLIANPDYQLLVPLNPITSELKEVIISDRKEHLVKASEGVSAISISPAQLASLPNLGEKDIFRSIQLLPGVSGTNETSSGLYVRGGTPDQNLILFDGFTVYHVDHFYGFFSAFNTNAVKDVQFNKGGFESKYGGRLSSVVSLTGKDGNNKRVSGNIGLSAISFNGSIEVPIINGKGSIFLAGRRSFTDIIRSGIYKDIFQMFENDQSSNGPQGGPGGGGFNQIENQPDFHFYDLNGKITFRPSNRDVISYSFYSGADKLDNSNEFNSNQFGGFGGGPFGGSNDGGSFDNNTVDLNDWGNIGTSLKWSKQWNERFYSNSVISYSQYHTNRDRYSLTSVTREDSTFSIRTGIIENNIVEDYSVRSDNEYLVSNHHTVEFGAQLSKNHVTYSQIQNDTINVLDRADQGLIAAGYLQDSWKPNSKFIVNPGIRVTYYNGSNKIYFEPRLSSIYRLYPNFKLKVAWGIYNQYITRVVREDISQGSRDFWLLADDDLNTTSSSIHYIAGLTYETNNFLFDIEAFYKDMRGLSEYTLRFSNNLREGTSVDELFYQGTGYSRGLEFLIQKKFGKYTGWIGYTLSEVIHDFPGISDTPYHALHDQTHEFKYVNSYRLGSWKFSGTWIYGTGKPYTSPIGGYGITLLDNQTISYTSVGEKNGYRLPDYHRMDLSVTYGWIWGKKANADLGLSVFNVYGRKNVWYKTFDIIDEELVVTDVNTLGFTPNLFFNLKF